MKTNLVLAFFGFIFTGVISLAHAAGFPECPQNVTPRSRLDFFCPKLEGSYFPSCCPLVSKSAPISCYYYTESTAQTKNLSQTVSCENGQNVTVQCCEYGSQPCNANVKVAPYIQRLFKGNGDECCYDDCPSAEYWSSTRGPTYGVTTNHKRYGRNKPIECAEVAASQNNCGSVTTSCANFSACPVTPSPNPTTPTPDPSQPSPGPSNPSPNPPNPQPDPPSPNPPPVTLPD